MRTVLTLAAKDLRVIMRDKFALFWIFAFPLMYAGFFGMLFGDSGGGSRGKIGLAIVDDDQSLASAALIDRLSDNAAVRVDREPPAEGQTEPGGFALSTLEAARDAVRKGRRAAYLRIPAGYGESPFAMFGGASDDQAGFQLGVDPRRSAEAGMLQGVLMATLFAGIGDLITVDKQSLVAEIERGRESLASATDIAPVQKAVLQQFMGALSAFLDQVDADVFDFGGGGDDGEGGGLGNLGAGMIELVDVAREEGNKPSSAFEITLPSAMIWGLMSVAMGFAITLVRERTQGTLLRLKVAPIGRTGLLAGKAVACFTACLAVMIFLLLFGVLALGVEVDNVPLLLLAQACTAVCFTGLMMVCAAMGKTEEAVAGTTWGVMMPFAMVGGGMIPLVAMPSWLLTVSNVSPFKWGILAVEGAVWRGFTVGDMVLPCAILISIGVGFFALGAVLFRRIGLGA